MIHSTFLQKYILKAFIGIGATKKARMIHAVQYHSRAHFLMRSMDPFSPIGAKAPEKQKCRFYYGPLGAIIQSAKYKLYNLCNAGNRSRKIDIVAYHPEGHAQKTITIILYHKISYSSSNNIKILWHLIAKREAGSLAARLSVSICHIACSVRAVCLCMDTVCGFPQVLCTMEYNSAADALSINSKFLKIKTILMKVIIYCDRFSAFPLKVTFQAFPQFVAKYWNLSHAMKVLSAVKNEPTRYRLRSGELAPFDLFRKDWSIRKITKMLIAQQYLFRPSSYLIRLAGLQPCESNL